MKWRQFSIEIGVIDETLPKTTEEVLNALGAISKKQLKVMEEIQNGINENKYVKTKNRFREGMTFQFAYVLPDQQNVTNINEKVIMH